VRSGAIFVGRKTCLGALVCFAAGSCLAASVDIRIEGLEAELRDAALASLDLRRYAEAMSRSYKPCSRTGITRLASKAS
jgi:hypothetical protein